MDYSPSGRDPSEGSKKTNTTQALPDICFVGDTGFESVK